MERIAVYLFSVFMVAAGAVMLTQWAYYPAAASAPFRVFALLMLSGGVYGGARVVKKA